MNYIPNDLNQSLTGNPMYAQIMGLGGPAPAINTNMGVEQGGAPNDAYAAFMQMMHGQRSAPGGVPMTTGWQGVGDKLHYIGQNLMARRQAAGATGAGGNPGFGRLYDILFGGHS